jgi:glutaredoxin-related protein
VQTPFSVILSWSIDGTEELPSCGVCSRVSSVLQKSKQFLYH